MKAIGKKTVALILALTMAMSLMSVTAWARYGSDTDDGEGIQTLSARSGTFGTNLQYELDENGVLTISVVDGATSGTMDNYTEESPSPFADADDINYIIIEEGCTNIGDYAFAGCRYISFVLIPASVRSIGEWAFKDDKVYTTLTLVFMGDAPYLSDSCFWQHELIVYYPMNTNGWGTYEYWDEVGMAISAIWYLYDPETVVGKSGLTYAFSDGLLTISGSGTVARGDLYTYLTSVGVEGSAVEGIEIDNSSGNITISYSAFTDCRKGIKAFIFIGDPPTFEPNCLRLISAQAYYPGYVSSWRSAVRSNYGGTLTWIDYEEGSTSQNKLFQWNPSSGGTSKMIMHIYDMDGNDIFTSIRSDGISISSASSITSGNKTDAWVVDIEGFVEEFMSGNSDYEFKYATITDPNIGNATAIANGYYNPTYYKGNVSGFQQFGSSANSVTSVQIYGYNDQSASTKNWEYTITTAGGGEYVVDLFGNANGGTADSKWSPYNLNINFYFDKAEEKQCDHANARHVEATSATCTTAGNSEYWYCPDCGKYFLDGSCTVETTLSGVTIAALGHTPVSDPAIGATCTETGLTEGSHCSVCNETIVAQEVIPALGHDYVATVTPPTCTEGGYTTYVCSRCSDSYADDYTDALGHDWDWDSGVVSKAATYSEPGDITYPCTRCDATYTEFGAIPILSPNFDVENETEGNIVTAAIGDDVELDAWYELDVEVLSAEDLDEGLTEQIKTAALAAVTDKIENGVIESGEYELSEPFWLEIDLLKWLDSEYYEPIDESWFEITITVPIPEELLGADNYLIVRMHDGAAEVLETKTDEEGVTVTFTADRFSVYALYAVNEAENSGEEDNTGTEDGENIDPTIPDADDDDDGTVEDLGSTDEENIEEPGSTDESDTGTSEDTGSTGDEGDTDGTETDDAEAPGDTDGTDDTGSTDNTDTTGTDEGEDNKYNTNEPDLTITGGTTVVVEGDEGKESDAILITDTAILSTDGESEDEGKTVDEDDSGKDSPKTDDTQMPYLMLTLFLLAICGFAVLLVCDLRRRSCRRR